MMETLVLAVLAGLVAGVVIGLLVAGLLIRIDELDRLEH